ncbi:MAG: gliding motility-associated C-terminal domain-containing protein [Sphingobacteriaceae bacterium]
MKKYIQYLLILFGVFFTEQLYSQAPFWNWARHAGANGVQRTNDVSVLKSNGDVWITGNYATSNLTEWGLNVIGGTDGFLVKYNNAGTALLARRIGGAGTDVPNSVCVQQNTGDVYITGYFDGTCNFNPIGPAANLTSSLASQDMFIAKFNSAGTFQWVVRAGGSGLDQGLGIFADANGVYVTGAITGNANFTSTNATIINKGFVGANINLFVAKYTTAGVVQWVATAESAAQDAGYDIVASTNSVYVVGDYYNNCTVYHSTGVSTGTILSAQTAPAAGDVGVFAFSQTGVGNWANNISSNGLDRGRGIALDASNVFITGGVRTNANFKYPTPTFVTTSTANEDMFLASMSQATGLFQWAKTEQGGAAGTEYGNSIDYHASGKLFITGPFDVSMNFVNSGGPVINTSGGYEVFLASYNATGGMLYATTAGSVNPDYGNGVAVDNVGDAYVGGEHGGRAVFQTAAATQTMLGTNVSANCFVAKCGCGNILSIPSAGADQTVCATSVAMAANTPTNGTGTWSVLAGAGTFANINSATSNVTALGVGLNKFVWRIAGSGCAPMSDTVFITRDNFPTTSNAGSNQTVCATTANLAGNTPLVGTGLWTLISGSGLITTNTSPTSGLTALGTGTNVFQWTISNGVCAASTSTVAIIRDASPTTANAGSNQTICATTANLAGNTPAVGTGTWTLLSGAGTITNPNSPTSGLTALGVGVNVFQWSIGNGVCPVSSQTVAIVRDANPTTSNAGPSQTICANTATLAANTPVVGVGSWNVQTGPGLLVTPTSPNTQVTSLGLGSNVFQWVITNGVCPASTSTVQIFQDSNPTVSNAGPSLSICAVSNTIMAANTPAVGTGTWTLISGSGVISNANSPTSAITGLGLGVNVFQWTIGNGVCPTSSSTMSITRYFTPTVSNAGPNQTVCATTANMAANTPAIGTGSWTLISGSGTITTPTLETTGITGLGVGVNVFQWTISNGVCLASSSTMSIQRDANPTVSNAGPSQTVCATTATMAANTPAIGSGNWTLISGAGTITTPTLETTGITALGVGVNIFEWTISNGVCPVSTSTMLIQQDAMPTVANAGPNQTVCVSTATLAGNTPVIGNGFWTLQAGSGVPTTPTSPNSQVTGLAVGINVFNWSITNGVCPVSSSTVAIDRNPNPTLSNAGPNQTVCATTANMAANVPAVGTGNWTLISGSGTITNPTSPTTGLTALGVGVNIFAWTITSGGCPPSNSTVAIVRDDNPTVSNAGPNQTLCATPNTNMAGNTPVVGTGLWTLVSGAGTIVTPNSEITAITGLGTGINVFQWTISNGVCPSSSSTVALVNDANPTISNAGPSQTVCSGVATMAANNPVIGSGLWTLISGSGLITTPTSPNTGLTGLGVGVNVFQWTISNGSCPPSTSTVIIQRDANPTLSSAGSNQTICATTTNMAGNTPAIGTGSWTLVSGSGTIVTPTLATTALTGLGVGVNVFQWTISNGVCASSSSTVAIVRDANPTVSNAGPTQSICASSTTANLAGNTPAIGVGVWNVVSGPGLVVTPTSPNSQVMLLGVGLNEFEWSITNGVCPASTSTVIIYLHAVPSVANAGASQSLCLTSSATMAGNSPAVGTGIWSLVSGSGLITTPSSPITGITALGLGANVFQWTISNGVCPPSTSTMSITRYLNPTISNAGVSQTVCATVATMAANTPAVGTGSWTLVSGAGTITSPTLPNTGITALGVGVNVFQWTISNGNCSPSTSTVIIQRDANPTIANAGANQTVCATVATLAGNIPAIGTGTWTLVSGVATISNPNLPNSGLTALGVGVNVLQWTIGNGVCPNSSATVAIVRDDNPTVSSAGPNQTVCATTATMAGNTPLVGTGLWTLVSGAGTISNNTSPTTGLTALGAGVNVFQWTISNGVCPNSTSTVSITRDLSPTVANAGTNQTVCATVATLAGNTPAVGTGSWTLVSGAGTITSPTLPNSGITALGVGVNVFQWTISNGSCPPSTATVSIQRDANPTVANAGSNQTLCASPTATLNGNTPVVGTGLWTLVSGAGTITSPNLPNTGITALGLGVDVFQWTISNGVCPASSATVAIYDDANPTIANAGTNQTVCATVATLAGNTPAVGTGSWTLISGAGTITSPAAPNSGITALGIGVNVFQWTISNGSCPPSSATVSIQRDANPSVSNAGTNQIICATSANLNGNTPAIGTGTWSLISGAGTITTPTLPTSAVTALGVGINVFQWTIGNGVCANSSSTVSIQRDANPTVSNAGPTQSVCANTSTANLAGNIPVVGVGVWNAVSGPGLVVTPTSPNSQVMLLGVGLNEFEWNITNGVCPSSTSTVSIFVHQMPTVSNAGTTVSVCGTATNLAGNAPAVGTGTWSLISGSGFITSVNLPNSGVTALGVGTNVFQWTIGNGVCPSNSSTVAVIRYLPPTVASAGPSQSVCASSATMAANAPAIGTGSWTLVSGAGSISAPTSPTSIVTALGSTTVNIFAWTITNGVCPPSTSTVGIDADAVPTVANAGSNQTICTSIATLNGNAPVIGVGSWSLVSGAATITTPTLLNTGITGIATGTNIFAWTITNGVCPPSSSTVAIINTPNPSISNAGPTQSVCASSATMAANVPAIGTGSWTLVSGLGAITTPTSPVSQITGMGIGPNVFAWTISNGVCPNSVSTVTIDADAVPTVANAGPNQTICTGTATLNANTPVVGTGSWTVVSGLVTITNTTLETTGLTAIANGTNILMWTISNGVCPPSTSTVAIIRDQNPSASNAGANQTVCATTANLNGNVPAIGTGTWSVISGPSSVTSPLVNNSGVTGLGVGANVYQWTIGNGVCPNSTSTVSIQRDANPSASNAGANQTVCATIANLNGNIPAIGTGTWSVLSGPSSVTSPLVNNSGVTGLGVGSNIFQWTIGNGVCPNVSSTVSIQRDDNPTVSNAGTNQTVCATTANLNGNIPTVGTGTWSVLSGPSSVTSPLVNNSGVTALGVGLNVYQWTIGNGVCPNSTSTVSIQRDANPIVASAGVNQTVCATTANLNGVIPAIGTGTWSVLSGPSSVTSPLVNNSGVTGLGVGSNIFQWTIGNGVCPNVSSTVSIQRDQNPTVSNAGASMSVCLTSTLLAGNIPSVGTGTWSLVSGAGTIATPTLENSSVSALGVGVNVFQWTIGNGVCPTSSSTVAITNYTTPSVSSAGANQTICATSTVLAANTPTIGSGSWSVLSGPAVVTTPASPNSGVTGLGVGANQFLWTIANGVCPVSNSTVTIVRDDFPSVANAGASQTICVDYATLNATPPVVGTGSWTLVSGTGTIVSPSSPTSSLINVPIGTDVLQWSVSNGVCPVNTSTVSITAITNVGPVNAGANIFFCGLTPTLAATMPTVGTGTWVPMGGPNVTSPNNPSTSVTFTNFGTYTYQWLVGYLSCPNLSSTVQVTLYDMPTPASVSADQTLCISSSNATISANSPTIGTGIWNVVTGGGAVTAPANTISPVTGLTVGSNSFEWVITNGNCPASTATVNIQVDDVPSIPIAGPDQTICISNTGTLNATLPLIGNGVWNPLGVSSVNTPTLNNSTVASLTVGSNSYEWSVTNGVCPSKKDTVTIFVDALPTNALAGADQFTCSMIANLQGNLPTIGTGTWMPLTIEPAVASLNNPNTSVSFTNQGVYTYVWVVGNGVCPVSTDTVVINTFLAPSDPVAGVDQVNCAMNATLVATPPAIGSGTWIPLNFATTISNSLTPTTNITVPSQGVYGFVWEVNNSVYCPAKRDTVYVQTYANPSTANAGIDITSDCLMNPINGNTPLVGNGSWSVLNGSGTFDNALSPSAQYISDVDGVTQVVWTITNGNCPSTSDTLEIRIDPMLIPQIITPNEDGNNDYFEIKAIRCLSGTKVSIFNRWGNLVYDSGDYKNDFKGISNAGEELADDTYYYILEIRNKIYKGYFVIKSN